MYQMLYILLVLANYPSIPSDIRFLSSDQFKVREAATTRLEKLPGWTTLYFKDLAKRAKDKETRLRCDRIQVTLQSKWEDEVLKLESEIILIFFPSIPIHFKAMGDHRSYLTRSEATKRLESLPGLTAPYFKYHAGNTRHPGERSEYERIFKTLDAKKRIEFELIYINIQAQAKKAKAIQVSRNLVRKIVANLSELGSEDLKLVEAQKYCPIYEPGCGPDPLGSYGVPVKITLKGQTVFLCSKDRIKKAQADPEKTLANVERVKKLSFRTKKQLEEDLKKMSDDADAKNK